MTSTPKKGKKAKDTRFGSILDMIEPVESENSTDIEMDSELTNQQTELLHRTYFSEAIGLSIIDQTQPVNIIRPHSTISDINTDKSIPPAKIFQGPSSVDEILARPGDDHVLDTDFPTTAYEPKVQLQYIVKPGALPRMVQVERLRRTYAKQDLEEVFKKKNVQVEDLIMTNSFSRIIKREKELEFTSFLPVELFDDTDFDVRSPQDWLNKAITKDGTRKALPAKAYLPNKLSSDEGDERVMGYQWCDVAVLDYNDKTAMWLIQPVNLTKRILEEGESSFWKKGIEHLDWTNLKSNQTWVPRIRLKFFAEDAYQFANRILAAVASRNEAEQIIRYWLCVDGMPTDGMSAMNEEMIERIIKWSTNIRLKSKWQDFQHYLEYFLHEAKLSFQKCMNRLLFDNLVTNDPELKGVVAIIPEKPTHEIEYKEIQDLVRYSFSSVKRKFVFRSFLVFKEAVWTMAKVREECNKPTDMSLFITTSSKSVKLEEFELVQAQATQQVHLFLKDSWGSKIVIDIRGFIQYVGKGWFDMNETSWNIYQMSKLKKFLKVVKFMMQDSLRFLVLDSLKAFVQLITDAAKDTLMLTEKYEWGPDLKTSPFKPKRNPIFVLDLIIDNNGIRYGTEIESFQTVFVNLFTKGVNATNIVEEVERVEEVFVMTSIYWHETPMLDTVGVKDPVVKEMKKALKRAVSQAIIPLKAYSQEFHQFLPLAKKELVQYISDYNENADGTLLDVKREIDGLIAYKTQLEQRLPSFIVIGPFLIQLENTRQFLFKKCKALSEGLLDFIIRSIKNNVEQITNEYKSLSLKLRERPKSLENINEIKDWMRSVPGIVQYLTNQAKTVLLDFAIPESYYYVLSDDDFREKASLKVWPIQIEKQLESCRKMLIDEEEKFARLLVLDQANLKERLENLMVTIGGLNMCSDLSKANEYANDVKKIMKSLKDCLDLSTVYNKREVIIGVPITSYAMIPKMTKLFEPYKQLWLTASDWLKWYDGWMNDSIISIDPEALEKNVNDAIKGITKLLKVFVELPNICVIILELKEQMEKFQPKVPVIQALRNPGMRARHWDEISEKMGFKVIPKPNISFAKYVEMGLDEHMEFMARIGEAATKEFQIEVDLEKMESSWVGQSLAIVSYKMSGTYTMKISEENQQMLDDQIVNTQSITFSPHKKPFEEKLNLWEAKLKLIQEVLEEWIKAQRSWLYLEPIFSSEDIVRQLPLESKKYQQMERHWRRILAAANKDSNIMSICPDPMLLNNFRECNTLLEQIQKGLSEYLETKRSGFPRFYFLSDDELLEILSQTRDPRAIQPYLRKCFESFFKIEFAPDLKMLHIVSFEGEIVPFSKDLYPVGEVEEWLTRIEDATYESIRDVIEIAIKNYVAKPRKKFVLLWPGQVVIAVCQNYWTTEVEEALNECLLDDYFQHMLLQLDDLRDIVRGDLKNLERSTLSALIVTEVHAKDVIQGMVEDQVGSSKDFEWIKQLRYYWMETHLYVQAVNAEFRYGYEYLGNTPRLVITPLTDRCYLTLTGALHLKFGGAPAGPAGTGKTETTKDLSKAMAIACIVFNCSDQLDYIAMAKFFKGLASSGAWACFDEFNRIDVEVLSVVAQQLQTIQRAIISKAKRFVFEGCDISLRDTCASFITMNPGYAGRSELPDNLKALFRPVAMMVPDYGLIAEISLFSFGFADTRFLARKISSTFRLASEQVSSQDHYDFGMRAVKSVIYAAGNLKREHPTMNEELILLRAIRDINVPKFLQDDLKLFTGIVSDLFPNTPDEPIDYGELEKSIRNSFVKLGLKDVEGFILKCIQLYDTTVVRHGLMLVGPTGSGKTKIESDFLSMNCIFIRSLLRLCCNLKLRF
uniref:AAA+ ATPase domain-containing protein n=1 Tax=Strigamia maritima TaxID=126957 RepID=T1J5R2_STRMM